MRGLRNLRVSVEQLRTRLQPPQGTSWKGSDWALDPRAGRHPSAERQQLVRAQVLANARQTGHRTSL